MKFYSKKLKDFSEIKHSFFTRKGGVSRGIYKGLNCGKGSQDKKRNVSTNLRIVAKKMFIENKKLILMYQTHSNKVVEIKKSNFKNIIRSDAMVTKMQDIALGVVTADCVPILIYDKPNKVIGCIHAGWKGAFNGIIENTISKIKKINSNNKIYAAIGPCIGVKNYEVDEKFFKNFISKAKKNKKFFTQKNRNKKLFNLRKFVSSQLLKHKVFIDHVNRDTFNEKKNFYSYRRSTVLKHKDYGRCISVIRLT